MTWTLVFADSKTACPGSRPNGYSQPASAGDLSVIQHDPNYGQEFTVGRGDLTRVSRWDVNQELSGGHRLTSTLRYNTLGSVEIIGDPSGHYTWISYGDSFSNDGTTDNTVPFVTRAYPTRVYDPDGYSSLMKYNYDLGMATRVQDPKGAVQTSEYDSARRVKRVVNQVNSAYTRFVYPASQTIVNKFATIQAGQGEAYSATILDGAGRVRALVNDFPSSAGHYSGRFTRYDVMGRAIQQANPTEMNSAWTAVGDDQSGWHSTLQSYDWKGRPRVTTHPSTTSNPNDTTTSEVSYSGCGCAGGEVKTLTDEGTMVDGILKRRQLKTYSDPLGRDVKTETLNWEGGSIYATTTSTYNAQDQVTRVQEFAGPEGSTIHQDTSMSYDGYGRLKTKHLPQEDSSAMTTYEYKDDDTLKKSTDARGNISTFTFNSRHLLEQIAYEPGNGIVDTPDVIYGYDSAGNRTSMSDGSGSVVYEYDDLSRLRTETRQFSGLNGSYQIGYLYNLAGELTKITDPDGKNVNYAYDKAGSLTGISGSSFGGVTQYATSLHYRAWGGVKGASLGDGRSVSASYDSRLQVTNFAVTNITLPDLISKSYEYNADGSLRYSQDHLQERFDRSYHYDQAGRITEADSGALARGGVDNPNRPYKLSFTYDALNNLTSRSGSVWWQSHEANTGTGVYVNGRNTDWEYLADGRLANDGQTFYSYDAVGSATNVWSSTASTEITQDQSFDGDGARAKLHSHQLIYNPDATITTKDKTQYFVTSSVLNRVITELNETGQKTRTFVYRGSQLLAWQQKAGATETMAWEYRDPSNASLRIPGAPFGSGSAELDPMASDAGATAPLQSAPADPLRQFTYPEFGSAVNRECREAEIDMPCSEQRQSLANALLPSWSISHARRHVDLRRTASIFPTSDMTLGAIFKESVSGTLLGDLLDPNPEDLWRYINPLLGRAVSMPTRRTPHAHL